MLVITFQRPLYLFLLNWKNHFPDTPKGGAKTFHTNFKKRKLDGKDVVAKNG